MNQIIQAITNTSVPLWLGKNQEKPTSTGAQNLSRDSTGIHDWMRRRTLDADAKRWGAIIRKTGIKLD